MEVKGRSQTEQLNSLIKRLHVNSKSTLAMMHNAAIASFAL